MAYFSQDQKKAMAPLISKLCKQYGLKGSLSVRHHSTVVLTISSGPIDFVKNYEEVTGHAVVVGGEYMDVNEYWYKNHFSGDALDFISKAIDILDNGNHDRSDRQTDYFDVGWYVDVKIGRWNKPYVCTTKELA